MNNLYIIAGVIILFLITLVLAMCKAASDDDYIVNQNKNEK